MIKIEKKEKKVTVKSPYNKTFVSCARKLGGKWNADAAAWVFDARDEERVRALCVDVYGTDGEECETVTLRVEFIERFYEDKDSIVIAGRQVARAWGRDSGAKLGDGVVLLNGSIGSGGSAKNWATIASPGTVAEIRDVPLKAAEKAVLGSDEETKISITDEKADLILKLEAQKAALLAQLSEVEAKIKDLQA